MKLQLVRPALVAGLLCLVVALPHQLTGQDPSSVAVENPSSEAEKIAREVGARFRSAYESADAEAIAGLFTEAGEFIDSERVVYSGRGEIQTEFTALFEADSGRRMELVVDSVRQVADGVIVEDGHAWILAGSGGPTTVSQYCSVLVKQGDQWKIASLRDIKSEFASVADRLDALGWIVGQWIDESDAGVVEYEFAWSDDNSFILGTFLIRIQGEEDFAGSVRIGWCPLTRQFKSWTFDSEGGVAVGHWNPIEEGWIIKNAGTRSDGVAGSSTNYYEIVNKDRVLWKSFDRHVGGEKQPDVEVTLVRRPPVPAPAPGNGDDANND
jgi:uncharacterized protein (TIGR02246 family)